MRPVRRHLRSLPRRQRAVVALLALSSIAFALAPLIHSRAALLLDAAVSCSTPPPASPSSSPSPCPSPSSPRPLAAGSPLPSLPSSPWLSSPALLSPASFGREPRPPAPPSRLAAVGAPVCMLAPPRTPGPPRSRPDALTAAQSPARTTEA